MLCKQKCARMQRFGCTRMQTPTAWFGRASFLHQGIGTVCFREGLKGTVVVIDRHMFRVSCGIWALTKRNYVSWLFTGILSVVLCAYSAVAITGSRHNPYGVTHQRWKVVVRTSGFSIGRSQNAYIIITNNCLQGDCRWDVEQAHGQFI